MPLTDPPLSALREYAYGGPVDVEVDPCDGHVGGRGDHQLRRPAPLRRVLA